jgi:hypothetical protein
VASSPIRPRASITKGRRFGPGYLRLLSSSSLSAAVPSREACALRVAACRLRAVTKARYTKALCPFACKLRQPVLSQLTRRVWVDPCCCCCRCCCCCACSGRARSRWYPHESNVKGGTVLHTAVVRLAVCGSPADNGAAPRCAAAPQRGAVAQ